MLACSVVLTCWFFRTINLNLFFLLFILFSSFASLLWTTLSLACSAIKKWFIKIAAFSVVAGLAVIIYFSPFLYLFILACDVIVFVVIFSSFEHTHRFIDNLWDIICLSVQMHNFEFLARGRGVAWVNNTIALVWFILF